MTKRIAHLIWEKGKSKGNKNDWEVAERLINEWWPNNLYYALEKYPQYQFKSEKDLKNKWEQLINTLFENWNASGIFD